MSEGLAANAISYTTLDRRRVYIVPTRHGVTLGLMLFVILLGSINYDNALGYMLAFLLSSLYFIVLLQTFRNLSGITFLGGEAAPVFAGQTMKFELTIRNETLQTRYALRFSATPRRSIFAKREADAHQLHVLEPMAIDHASITVNSERRGWLQPERVRISTTFPLGIFRAWADFPAKPRGLVYPKPLGHASLPSQLIDNELGTRGGAIGDDDFSGLRPYIPGDPVRAISWKALARDDTVSVKKFTGHGDQQIYLRWRDTAHLADIELRLSQLALWVVSADRHGNYFALELPDQIIELGTGLNHRNACLAALALFQA